MKVLVVYQQRTGDLVALARPSGAPPAGSREPHPSHEVRPQRGQAVAELEVPAEHADRDLLEIAALYRVRVGRAPSLELRPRREPRARPPARPARSRPGRAR